MENFICIKKIFALSIEKHR